MATANIANTKIVPSITTIKPYYDDFDESKNFHRVLFRPGYAVQARELTQLQTILQNQIERFGNHVFQNGSLVLGGGISLDSESVYINLDSTFQGTEINVSSFISSNITYGSGNVTVRAYVTSAVAGDDVEPPVIMVKYLTGDEFSATSEIRTTDNTRATVAASGPSGYGTTASINDGIFFINGYFVKVPTQTIVIDKYSQQANAKIGLEFSEDIINESQDSSLLDPAQEASNFQAPGATRLKVNFDLATRSLESTDDSQFIELVRVENGSIKKQVIYPVYSALGDTLARRTYDESGNYTVDPFRLVVANNTSDQTKLNIILDPGKAYIKGYEFESIAAETLTVNKARDSMNVYNQDITLNFGNYFFVQNVKGYFDLTTAERIDMHSVPIQYINYSSTTSYAQTKVGSARTRELKYYSATSTSDPETFVYTISIFDTQFANLISNVVVASANGFSIFDTGVHKFSANNNAYNGAILRTTGGTGSGQKHTVTNYVGSTKTFNVSPNFVTTPDATTNVSIDFNIKSVDSLLKHQTYTSAASDANANINILSKDNGLSSGNTYLTDTTFNTLVFPFAERWIKDGSITQQDYQYFRVEQKTFDGSFQTVLTLTEGETFAGVTDSTGKSLTTLQSFAAFRTNGKRLNLTNVVVDNSGDPDATLTNSESYTGTAYVYYLVNLNSGNRTIEKAKILYTGNSTHYVTSTANARFNTATSAGVTNTSVFLNDGQVIISNPSNLPGQKMSLHISDVKKINKIYDLNGQALPAAGTNISANNDVTRFFVFDNGQRDSHYDHASISLAPKRGSFKGPLIVSCDWYDHVAGDGAPSAEGYFSVDSYDTYTDIPSYTTSQGTTISLRDAIDFRPRRQNATNANPGYVVQGARFPSSTTSFESNYQFYVGKKAHVVLTTDSANAFQIIDGISSRNPSYPRVIENTMILYKLNFEPYTITEANVTVNFVENKRYTMRDIGRLERRIENLEYYQTLSALERAASTMSILDADGLERTKYGIVADNFSSHGYGDIKNEDYYVSIDRFEGSLNPAQNTVQMPLVITSTSGVKTVGPISLLNYTEEVFLNQNVATKFSQVQPYMIAQWVGSITMNPPDDNWIDVSIAPEIVINTGENDALETANDVPVRSNTVYITERNYTQTWYTAREGGRTFRTTDPTIGNSGPEGPTAGWK